MSSSPGTARALPTRVDIAVIGGGIAGLLAARAAARAGRSVVVIEASPSVGGRLAPVTLAGIELDAGAESFATRGGTVQALVEELGMADAVVAPAPSPAWVVAPGEAYPLPTTSWLGIPSAPLSREVRRVLGWPGAARAAWDLVAPPRGPAPDATLGAVSRARLGRAATERLVAPVVTGVYTRPVDEIPLDALAPGLAAEVAKGGLIRAARARRAASPPGSAVRSVRGGLFRLALAVADEARTAGARIVTGVRVARVRRGSGGWLVGTTDGEVAAGRVVIAVPRHEADAMIRDERGVAADGAAAATDGDAARRVAIVVLVLDTPALDAAPRGTGALVRPGVTRAKALTHASAKWEWIAAALPSGRHVVRLSYDLDGTPGDLVPDALADASTILGVELGPSALVESSQHVWVDAAPAAFDPASVPEGVTFVGAAAGLTGLAAIVGDVGRIDFS